jgi:O-antigen ligase
VEALAILFGIEAVLLAIAYRLSRGDWRRIALYLLAATAPLEVYRTVIGKVDISLFRLSLLIALAVLATAADPRATLRRFTRLPLVRAYSVFAGVVALALIVHPINPFLAERQLAQIIIGVVALGVVAELARTQSIARVAVAIVLGAILPILAAIWQGLAPEIGASEALPLLNKLPAAVGLEITRQALSSFGTIGARAKGTFGDPNHFGVYLGFVVCLSLALTFVAAQRRNRVEQISYGAMAAAASATLVATFSRSAWVGTVVAIALIVAGVTRAWHTKALRPPTKRLAVVAALVTLAISAGLAPRVIERVAPGSKINVVSDRSHASTVRFAWHQFVSHPVLGIGPGGLGIKLHLAPRTSGAHSTYLTVAGELGTVGLLALFLVIAITLGLLARAYRRLRGTPLVALALGLGAAYVGYLASNVTYDIFFDDFHWIMLGAVTVLAVDAASIRHPTEAESGRDGLAGFDPVTNGARSLAARLSHIARNAWPV